MSTLVCYIVPFRIMLVYPLNQLLSSGFSSSKTMLDGYRDKRRSPQGCNSRVIKHGPWRDVLFDVNIHWDQHVNHWVVLFEIDFTTLWSTFLDQWNFMAALLTSWFSTSTPERPHVAWCREKMKGPSFLVCVAIIVRCVFNVCGVCYY